MATRPESTNERTAITLDLTIRLLQEQQALSASQALQVQKSVNPDDDRHPFVRLADLGLRRFADCAKCHLAQSRADIECGVKQDR